jgi:hypothetical protein
MPSPRKDKQIRKPLTDAEDKRGATYYTAADRKRILATFLPVADFEEDRFFDSIELAASIYLVCEEMHLQLPQLPSELRRNWKSLLGLAAALMVAVDGLSFHEREDLRGSAEAIAAREGLEGFEPDPIAPHPADPPGLAPMATWPVDEKFERLRGDLKWLERCIAEADEREKLAMRGKPASNRPDEPKRDFIRTVHHLYVSSAAKPARPYHDAVRGVGRGEIVDLLKACFTPLGVKMQDTAILRAYERATKGM